MDPLEDIFAAMRLQSALYARIQPRSPWGIDFEIGQVARFGLVVKGDCWLTSPDMPHSLPLTAGDCFIINREAKFSLLDHPTSPSLPCETIFSAGLGDTVTFGGEGNAADIIIGRFVFDAAGGEPLMSLLPSVMHIANSASRAPWLQSTLQLIALESSQPQLGSRLVINRLADVLFIQAIRAWNETHGKGDASWLCGWSDPRLGAVMRALHHDLAHPWQVASLAHIANMSRSAFAGRFKQVVGYAPLDYLLRWRMYRARCLLRHPDLSLIEIANRVGYESTAAFHRAFRRETGFTPGEFRLAAKPTKNA